MISNLRRYKNDIARLKKMVETVKGANSYINYIDGDVTKYAMPEEPPFYKVNLIMAWRVPVKGNVILSEDKSGVVYIGMNLDNVETHPVSFNIIKRAGLELDSTVTMIKRSYLWERTEWKDLVLPYAGIDYDTFDKDPNLIKNTKVYREVQSVVDKMESSFKIDISLDGGSSCWPKLENRHLYPILIVDFEKATVSLQTSEYAETSRQAITTLPLSVFTEDSIKRHDFSKYLYTVKASCQYGEMK